MFFEWCLFFLFGAAVRWAMCTEQELKKWKRYARDLCEYIEILEKKGR